MGNLLQILTLIAGLLPLVHQTVLVVEQAIPGAAKGAQKLDAATQIVSAVLPAVGATAQQIEALQPAIRGVINGTVSAMNAGGVLPSSPAPAAATSSSAAPAAH